MPLRRHIRLARRGLVRRPGDKFGGISDWRLDSMSDRDKLARDRQRRAENQANPRSESSAPSTGGWPTDWGGSDVGDYGSPAF
jgi:hypothetical protein